MIIPYIRSSSYSAYDFCEFRYFIEYCLNWKAPANAKAIWGTMVHKCLEIMALQKLAEQNGKDFIIDDDSRHKFLTCEPADAILEKIYPYITSREAHISWSDADYQECASLLNKAITFSNGLYNPKNQNIVSPEQRFDIEIKKPWAWFDYPEINLKGYLAIRGTIDLVILNESGFKECVDYKTGKPKWNWNADKEKSFADFNKDPQLVLYYYALRNLYPDDKEIMVTIYYIKSGEPITVMFDDDTVKYAEDMLQKRFNRIKSSFQPKRIYPNWKCTKLCHYGKFTLDNEPTKDYSKSMCSSLSSELKQIGLTKLWEKRAKDKGFAQYSGGGRQAESE